MGNLRVYGGADHTARGPDAREARHRQVEPQEHEGRIIMAESIQSLDQLSQLKTAAPRCAQAREEGRQVQPRLRHRQAQDAVARVWIKPGAGKVTVNAREVEVYFARPVLRMMIEQPFVVAARAGQYDVICTVAGGGLSARPARSVTHLQGADLFRAGAARRAQEGGFLTRDSRVVERKKYGKAKARRSFQFSKRNRFGHIRREAASMRCKRALISAPFLLFVCTKLIASFLKTWARAKT